MLKDRFLSVFALAFAAGIATPFVLGTETKAVSFIVLLCLAAVAVSIYIWASYRMRELTKIWIYPLIFVIGMSLGVGWLWLRSVPYAGYEQYLDTTDTVEGVVTESGSSDESGYLELKLERSKAALPKGTRIRLYCDLEQTVHIGDRVGAELMYSALTHDSQKANKICLTANGKVNEVSAGTGIVTAVRNAFLQACDELYGQYGVHGTAQALTVRERTSLSAQVSDAYRNAGLSHLLAISGLHLNIIIAALRSLLSAFGMRKRTREVLALLVILFYCVLAGFSPSVVRASIMLGAVVLGEILLSESDSLTVLFLALTVLLIANPFALLSLGLQLSFLSCLGILLLQPMIAVLQRKIRGKYDMRFYRLRRMTAALVGSLAVTVSAVVFTFPVTMLNFGTFSYLSPLSNLVFVPLYSHALPFLMLSVLLFPFVPSVASVVAFLPGQVIKLCENALLYLDDKNIGTFATESYWVLVPCLFAAAAIVCMLLFFRKGIWLYIANTGAFLLSLTLCALLLPRPPAELLIVSAEQGFIYADAGADGGTFLDLGCQKSSFEISDSTDTAITEYIVTQTDDAALMRLASALKYEHIQTVYLPVLATDGTKNDLTVFLTLTKQKDCTVVEYFHTVQTKEILYSAQDGTAKTVSDTAVMLYGIQPAPRCARVVLMPAYVGELQSISPDTLYIPLGYGEMPPSNLVHLYDGGIAFADGEVKTD